MTLGCTDAGSLLVLQSLSGGMLSHVWVLNSPTLQEEKRPS
jgi:hypothetical protein